MSDPIKKTFAVHGVKVGQTFQVNVGGTLLKVLVIEDRGNLGPGGTRLVRVEVKPGKDDGTREAERFEIPAGALVPA